MPMPSAWQVFEPSCSAATDGQWTMVARVPGGGRKPGLKGWEWLKEDTGGLERNPMLAHQMRFRCPRCQQVIAGAQIHVHERADHPDGAPADVLRNADY